MSNIKEIIDYSQAVFCVVGLVCGILLLYLLRQIDNLKK